MAVNAFCAASALFNQLRQKQCLILKAFADLIKRGHKNFGNHRCGSLLFSSAMVRS